MNSATRQLLVELGQAPDSPHLGDFLLGMANATSGHTCDEERFLDTPALRAVLRAMHEAEGEGGEYREPEADGDDQIYISASALYSYLSDAWEAA